MADATRYVFPALGSECVLHLFGGTVDLAAAVEAEIERIEQRYSRYRPDSLLSQINRVAANGGALDLDDETAGLIDYAYGCHRKSGGRFDITTGLLRQEWNFKGGRPPDPTAVAALLPRVGMDKLRWERPRLSFPVPGMELDLGGIGKEYAADVAAGMCRDAGVAHGLVDLGGDLHAIGPRPDGRPWEIRLRSPRAGAAPLLVLPLTAGGLATSGDYERCIVADGRRLGHILDPRTGWPVEGLASVTVAADSCLLAGSISTIAMLRGSAGPAWLQELGVACVWVDTDGRTGGSLAPA